jgi:hypothetical protein
LEFFLFYVHYSILLHLTPLRFHCVATQSEEAGTEPRIVATLALTARRSNNSARSHPHLARSHPLVNLLSLLESCFFYFRVTSSLAPAWEPLSVPSSTRSTRPRPTCRWITAVLDPGPVGSATFWLVGSGRNLFHLITVQFW